MTITPTTIFLASTVDDSQIIEVDADFQLVRVSNLPNLGRITAIDLSSNNEVALTSHLAIDAVHTISQHSKIDKLDESTQLPCPKELGPDDTDETSEFLKVKGSVALTKHNELLIGSERVVPTHSVSDFTTFRG